MLKTTLSVQPLPAETTVPSCAALMGVPSAMPMSTPLCRSFAPVMGCTLWAAVRRQAPALRMTPARLWGMAALKPCLRKRRNI